MKLTDERANFMLPYETAKRRAATRQRHVVSRANKSKQNSDPHPHLPKTVTPVEREMVE